MSNNIQPDSVFATVLGSARLIPFFLKKLRFVSLLLLATLVVALTEVNDAQAAPAFQAAGAAIGGTGSVIPVWPAHAIDDIALLFIESAGGEPATFNTAAGFVAVANSPQATGTGTAGTRITVYWARAISTSMPNPDISDPGNHVYAQIITYRGVITTGDPWDVTGGGFKTPASTSVTVTGVTTTVPDTLIVQAVARDNDSAAAAFSAQTNANLTGIAERSDAGTASNNGGGFAVWDGVKATAGATGNTTATVTNSINAFLTIALKPQLPAVISINRADANPTSATSVSWSVTFNTSVTGVNTSDFTLVQAGGVSGASITSVTGSGTSWTVTANTGSGNGTLGLNLVDDDSIVAGAIPLGGAGAGNGNFTGQVYTVDKPATIINTYYPGTADVAIGATTITLGAPTGATGTPIVAGDLVLIMQMQDASIDSTNTATYGDGAAGDPGSGATVRNSGLYEYAVVASFSSPTLTLTCGTKNAYTNAAAGTDGQRKFQVIRVPVYASYTLGAITARAWDGSTGGVLAFDVTGALALNSATVSVSGLGFRGGAARGSGTGSGTYTDYRTPVANLANGTKGEGIAGTPYYVLTPPGTSTNTGVDGYPNGSFARGAPGNAGGGGTDRNPAANDQNSGGGGGANAGAGGIGGIGWCPTPPFTTTGPYYGCGYSALDTPPGVNPGGSTGGFGGVAVTGLGPTRVTLGGGGGSGTTNNSTGTYGAVSSSGAAGGGIVMIRAGSMTGSATFNANGSNGDTSVCNDGSGGGGGGGAVLINAGSGMNGVTINVNGGSGGSNLVPPCSNATPHGPGGGGGGGYAITSAATATPCNKNGGANGVSYNGGVLFGAYGSTPGSAGSCVISLTSAQIPGATIGPVSACSAVDHYAISYPGGTTAVTCDPHQVTITGHDSGHAAIAPAAGTVITLNTSTGTGVWTTKDAGSGTWTPSGLNNGTATYTWPGVETSFTVRLRHTSATTLGVNLLDSNAKTESATEDPNLTFANAAFRVTDAAGAATVTFDTHIAGKNSDTGFGAQTRFLQAIRTDAATGSCVALIQNQTVTVQMAGARINPTGGASQVSVRNSAATMVPVATSAGAPPGTFTGVSLAFDAQSKAPLVFNYPDAGSIAIYASYQLPSPPAGINVTGSSNTFVVRPFGLRISGVTTSASPAPTDPVFAVAGQNFNATVTAVAWKAGDDTDANGVPDSDTQIASNAATPNFGQETPAASACLGHKLAAPPVGGVNGALAPQTGCTVSNFPLTSDSLAGVTYGGFLAGVSTQAVSWSEVGFINLWAQAQNYLGSGQDVTNSAAGLTGVGRFRPDHFTLSAGALANRGGTCPGSNFTYLDEGLNLTLTLTAEGSGGGTTQNYFGGYALLTPATFSNYGFGARSGTTNLTSRITGTIGTPTPSWTSGMLTTLTASVTVVARTATPSPLLDGPWTNTQFGIAPQDSDTVQLQAAMLDMNVDSAGGNDHQSVGVTTELRFGRLRLQNAYGSELLPLPVPMTVQYWNGTAFITNNLDSCTTLVAGDIGFANYVPNLGSGDTSPTVGPVLNGVGTLTLSAPGANHNGSVDLVINLGTATTTASCTTNPTTTSAANRSYLRGRWCGAAYDKDPTARTTFGVYKNPSQFIYLREMY